MIPSRLEAAEIAAEHAAWARSIGMTAREAAAAIGWTVPPATDWGLIAALYAGEAGKLVDRRAGLVCAETVKAGCGNIRPAAIRGFRVVSSAGGAASDLICDRVKDRALMPESQEPLPAFMAIERYDEAGSIRSEWRSAN